MHAAGIWRASTTPLPLSHRPRPAARTRAGATSSMTCTLARLPTTLSSAAARCTWVRAPGRIPRRAIPATASRFVPCQIGASPWSGVHDASSASRVTGMPASEWPWQARTLSPSSSRRPFSFSSTTSSRAARVMRTRASTSGTLTHPAASIASPSPPAPWRSSHDSRLLSSTSFRPMSRFLVFVIMMARSTHG